MVEKHSQYLILFVAIGLLILSLSLIGVSSSAPSQASTDTGTDRPPLFFTLGNSSQNQQPCSYLISTNGTFIKAQNCQTNHIDFSGADASTVINQAINSTTASQLVFIKKGIYGLNTPIELQHGLTLEGESAGQNVTNGRQGTHLWVASGKNINALEYTKGYLGYFITIQNLFIDGNYPNNPISGNGIYLNVNASDIEVNNVYIDGFRQNCFLSDSSFNYRFFGSTFEHCQKDGVYIKAGTDVIVQGTKALSNNQYGYEFGTNNGGITSLMFIGNYIAGNVADNLITFNVQGGTYVGNAFNENAGFPPNVDLVEENNCSGSMVIGNSMSANGHTSAAVDITHGTCTASGIIGNTFNGAFAGTKVLDSGTSTVIRNNLGFKTENSGTATIGALATSIAVTHGLAYTPSINDISITPQGNSNSCTSWWISNPTSTQFTINCNSAPTTASLSFSWEIKRT